MSLKISIGTCGKFGIFDNNGYLLQFGQDLIMESP